MNKKIFFTSIIGSLDFIDITFFNLILYQLNNVYNTDLSTLLWVQYAYLLSSIFMTLLFGILHEKLNLNVVLLFACLLYFVGTILVFLELESFYTLILGRVISGCSIGIFNVSSVSILYSNLKGDDFVKASSKYSISLIIINFICISLYGIIEEFYNFRKLFYLNFFVVGIIFFFCLQRIFTYDNTSEILKINKVSSKYYIFSSNFLYYISLSTCYYSFSLAAITFFSLLSQESDLLQLHDVSFIISLRSLGCLMGFILLPKIYKSVSDIRILSISTIMCGLCYYALSLKQVHFYYMSFLTQGLLYSFFNTLSLKRAFLSVPNNFLLSASSIFIFVRSIGSLVFMELTKVIYKYIYFSNQL